MISTKRIFWIRCATSCARSTIPAAPKRPAQNGSHATSCLTTGAAPTTCARRYAFEYRVNFNELLKTALESYLDQSQHPQAKDERIPCGHTQMTLNGRSNSQSREGCRRVTTLPVADRV
jgi:hypothetical protein